MDLGRTIKSAEIGLKAIGSLLKNDKNKTIKKGNNRLVIDIKQLTATKKMIHNSTSLSYKQGTIGCLEKLKDVYKSYSNKLVDLDKEIFKLDNKKEYTKKIVGIKKKYNSLKESLGMELDFIQNSISDIYVISQNIESDKNKIEDYMDEVLNKVNNVSSYRSFDRSYFDNYFADKIEDKSILDDMYNTYTSIRYTNLNEIMIFTSILFNIKISSDIIIKQEAMNNIMNLINQ